MKALFYLAGEIQDIFQSQNWKFCFIGGIALQRWGEARLTRDVDISLFSGFREEEPYIDFLLREFPSRIENPKDFALKNRVLLLKSEQGIPIDIALAALPFEEEAVKRSSKYAYLKNVTLRTCSAEDLIIFKAFADRTRDWADIEGILMRQNKQLDWEYIFKWLQPLCELKESPEIRERLQGLREKLK